MKNNPKPLYETNINIKFCYIFLAYYGDGQQIYKQQTSCSNEIRATIKGMSHDLLSDDEVVLILVVLVIDEVSYIELCSSLVYVAKLY